MRWLPGAEVHDFTSFRGNGPFGNFLGVILHVNVDENGTSDSFFGAGPSVNPDSVTPNFQVYKDGSIHQYLPLDWQPWCQANGNYNYAAIETAGMPNEPLTTEQLHSIARIVKAYHEAMGMPLQITNSVGGRGLGTHKMGGASWGGHDCPGDIRAAQREQIIRLAKGEKIEEVDEVTDEDIRKIAAAVMHWDLHKGGPNVAQILRQTHSHAEWADKHSRDASHALNAKGGVVDRVAQVQRAVSGVADAVAEVAKAVAAVTPAQEIKVNAAEVADAVFAKVKSITWKAGN